MTLIEAIASQEILIFSVSTDWEPHSDRSLSPSIVMANVFAKRPVGTYNWTLSPRVPHVPLNRLLDIVKQRLVADDIVELIRVVTANERNRGLRQGSATFYDGDGPAVVVLASCGRATVGEAAEGRPNHLGVSRKPIPPTR